MIFIIGFVVIGIGLSIVLVYDAYLAAFKGFESTLSYWLMLNGSKYPIIPFAIGAISFGAIGLLAGHLFWSQTLNVTIPCPVSQ